MANKIVKPDTMNDIGNTDLVQLSRKLLDSAVRSSKALNLQTLNEKSLKELRLVLGFLNVTNNIVKTKMSYFKMVGLGEKVDAVKKLSKKL